MEMQGGGWGEGSEIARCHITESLGRGAGGVCCVSRIAPCTGLVGAACLCLSVRVRVNGVACCFLRSFFS